MFAIMFNNTNFNPLASKDFECLKSTFLDTISHELRTPISGIIGMTDLVLETELDDMQRRYLEIAQSCAESLLRTINQLIKLTRIQVGQYKHESDIFTLDSVISRIESFAAPLASKKKLELLVDCKEDSKNVYFGCAEIIINIIEYIVDNAIKFTEVGSVVVSAESKITQGDVSTVKFSIRDTGIGIPESLKSYIFDRFTQVDNGSSRYRYGLGVGLAIAKSLTDLIGGEIYFYSDGTSGSVFHIEFPLEIARV